MNVLGCRWLFGPSTSLLSHTISNYFPRPRLPSSPRKSFSSKQSHGKPQFLRQLETANYNSHSSEPLEGIGKYGLVAACGSWLLLLLLPDMNPSPSLESPRDHGVDDGSVETTALETTSSSNRCKLSWVTASDSTQAECSVFKRRLVRPTTTQHEPKKDDSMDDDSAISAKEEEVFDPAQSTYFKVKLLTQSTAASNVLRTQETDTSSILHNTIVVLPHLMTTEECHKMVLNAERILEENKKTDQKGCRTESWTMYARFDEDCRSVMDRVLGNSILDFLELRMEPVADQLFEHHHQYRSSRSSSSSCTADDKKYQALAENDLQEKVRYHWDDPVVIKYSAGNALAPHEDMRPLTVVIPLNPLEDFPLGGGGGTRFWLEGTRPDCALGSGGVSVQPRPGAGILFNGEITHSGNSVESGTRFVLMTSITLDDPDDDVEG